MITKSHIVLVLLIGLVTLFSCKDNSNEDFTLPSDDRYGIVLITDFTPGSDVVITIKGMLTERYSDAEISFIQAAPFNVMEASYQLFVAAENYPDHTYFMCIVEPGSDTERMVFKTENNQLFVVPDNGLATNLFHSSGTPECYHIQNPFDCNGLDPADLNFLEVYTYAMFDIIDNRKLDDFGARVDNPEFFNIQDAIYDNGIIYGQVVFTDNFGNCVTNIPDNLLLHFDQGSLLAVDYGDKSFFATLGSFYSSVPVFQNVVFNNGLNKLELAVNMGSMETRYNIGAGTIIQVYNETVDIGILQFSELSAPLVEIVKDQINASGISANYIEKNAMGNFDELEGLVNELVQDEVNILIPFSTPASQSAVLHTSEDIPIVFTIVTDPGSAGILDKRENLTGLSDAPNYDQFIDFVTQIIPGLSKAGTIYNNLESNSLFSQDKLNQYVGLYQIELVSAIAHDENGIQDAYNEISNTGIEAIMISGDNTMTNGCETLVDLALADNLPIFGTDMANAADGALASLSIDYEKLCIITGDVVVSVIRGVNPDNVPVTYFHTDVIAVNTATAGQLGIIIPQDIIDSASYIFP